GGESPGAARHRASHDRVGRTAARGHLSVAAAGRREPSRVFRRPGLSTGPPRVREARAAAAAGGRLPTGAHRVPGSAAVVPRPAIGGALRGERRSLERPWSDARVRDGASVAAIARLDQLMQLLVSVSNAAEAAAAIEGGADLIDAKDPRSGALGAVAPDVLRAIYAAVGGSRPVTAALGDAADEDAIERRARAFTAAGAQLVKVGFAGISDIGRVASLLGAAVRGADGHGAVVAVFYADAAVLGHL